MSESVDFRPNVLDKYKCGDYIFSSNFDSGNLGRVEALAHCADREIFGDIPLQAEFNVWTTPDCFGTPNESPNRTWFFFSIIGGHPFHNARINVKNLNRQSKLFGHGMSPVMRVGKHGKWERIRDKPTYQNEEDNFMIAFIHRVNDNPDIEIFYAFTYPFTYTECQNMLFRFDHKYGRSVQDKTTIINRLLENEEKLFIKKNQLRKGGSKIDISASTSSEDTSGNEGVFEKMNLNSLQNEIYYHRELLINSLENRRIDLLTITSFHGIQNKREDSLINLFPENARCHCFKDKKIIFLSSRVHPGETPASFVLNGFLNLILDKKSSIANTLRKIYVFKIIPILNPDGVFRGFYRTDTLGQNLNRMYIDTQLYRHPSIYAVKKLIRFYNFGIDTPDENELQCSNLKSGTTIESDQKSINSELNKPDQDKEVLLEKIIFSAPLCSSKTNISSEGEEITAATCDPCSKKSFTYTKKYKEQKIRKSNVKATHSSLIRNFEQKLKENGSIQHRLAVNKKNYTKNEIRNHCGTSKMYLTSPKLLNTRSLNNSTASGIDDGNCKLFLYIDMHGHASKKGVFMYGNHFPYTPDAVDCMLLPRLMTLNCQHFHYDACNFSERNMYRREKRDGLSKEGSGRVSVYKMTGLIKSYTLECNYNCGKYVNVLPSRGSSSTNKTVNCNPPKYTPAIYEEVGRALGSSILDITNSNTISRIHNSDFRSLQGLRIALRNEIERNSFAYRQAASHTTPHKITATVQQKTNISKKRNILSTTVLPTYEIAKENKFHTIPWKTKSSNSTQSVAQSNVSLKISRNIKKTAFKIRPINIYGKKDAATISKKKPKILVETSNASRKDSPTSFNAVPNKKVKISFRNAIQLADALTSTTNTNNGQILSPVSPHVVQFHLLPVKNIKTIERTVNEPQQQQQQQQQVIPTKNLLKANSFTNSSCPPMDICLKKSISDSEICNIMANPNTSVTAKPSQTLNLSKPVVPTSCDSTSQMVFHTAAAASSPSTNHTKTITYIKSEINGSHSRTNSIDLTNKNQENFSSVFEDSIPTSSTFKETRNICNDSVIFKRKINKKQISRY